MSEAQASHRPVLEAGKDKGLMLKLGLQSKKWT